MSYLTPLYYKFIGNFKDREEGFTTKEAALFFATRCPKKVFGKGENTESVIDGLSKGSKIRPILLEKTRAMIDKLNKLGTRVPPEDNAVETGETCKDPDGDKIGILEASGFPGNKIYEIIPRELRYTIHTTPNRQRRYITRVVDLAAAIGKGKKESHANKILKYSINKAKEVTRENRKLGDAMIGSCGMTDELQELIKIAAGMEAAFINATVVAMVENSNAVDLETTYTSIAKITETFSNKDLVIEEQDAIIKSLEEEIAKVKEQNKNAVPYKEEL
jgi:hypothetical protein